MNNIFKPLNKDAEIHRRRRYLPHWKQSGCTYFVTFRTADSLPQSKLKEMNEQKKIWMSYHPEPWSEQDWDEYNRRFTEKIQTWLDAGYGACVLQQPELSAIVASALRYFDHDRYVLDEFVVMPNHAHALLMPQGKHVVERILHTWKSYTANKINAHLGVSGMFWMNENFDHAVRSWDQLERFRRYIRENPAKAGLREGSFLLGAGKTGIAHNVTRPSRP